MSSWREKLANKTTTAVNKEADAPRQTSSTAEGGWKQRITEKQGNPAHHKPILPKVSIDDLNEFPVLGGPVLGGPVLGGPVLGGASSAQTTKKQPVLTGFASLAKDWSVHDKEEKQREDKERMYREQQENAYNYNISKLSAINNRLMSFTNHNQVRYNDEYNADYERDLDYHNDTAEY
jgi:hypothetical protein